MKPTTLSQSGSNRRLNLLSLSMTLLFLTGLLVPSALGHGAHPQGKPGAKPSAAKKGTAKPSQPATYTSVYKDLKFILPGDFKKMEQPAQMDEGVLCPTSELMVQIVRFPASFPLIQGVNLFLDALGAANGTADVVEVRETQLNGVTGYQAEVLLRPPNSAPVEAAALFMKRNEFYYVFFMGIPQKRATARKEINSLIASLRWTGNARLGAIGEKAQKEDAAAARPSIGRIYIPPVTTGYKRPCYSCRGTGKAQCYYCVGTGTDTVTNRICNFCYGSGRSGYCSTCNATGSLVY